MKAHRVARFDRRHAAALAICIVQLASVGCAGKPPVDLPRTDAPPGAVERLGQDILAATRRPGVQRGVWGIVVHSLDRDERLFELNPDTLLVPASAAKLVTVASAADAVGWDFTYETSVLATGPIVDGTLRGDVLVVGSGDPAIGGPGGHDLSDWIGALQAVGISRIEGRIIGDDDAVEEPRPALAWAWDDLGYVSGTLFGALNFAQNRMVLQVTPGAREGEPTSLQPEPFGEHRPLANRTVTSGRESAALLWPEQRPGESFLTIAGWIPAGAPPARVAVSVGNPTLWFATALRHLLRQHGIDVTGGAFDIDDLVPPPDGAAAELLFTYRSRPLREMVQPLLKNSINVYGEAVLRLNAGHAVPATNDAALDGLRSRLAAWGVPEDGQQLVDGSGLSRRNTITANTLLLVLQRMHDPAGTSPFVTALPVAGVDGSLASRMKATVAAGNVRAKTGTMSNVRSLAGYATARDGERLAFVILVNNFEGAGSAALEAIDAMAVRLASFSRAPVPITP